MKIITIFFILLFCGCDLICGLKDTPREMLEMAQEKFNTYCRIENIPCESYYMNIKLKVDENAELTAELHKMLYHEKEKIGWLSLHIYDKNGVFLITHHYKGKRSTVAPNW